MAKLALHWQPHNHKTRLALLFFLSFLIASMASSRTESRTLCFSLLPCLLLFALFTPTSSSARTLPSDSGKVSLALYYESLCPYSANFIVNYLVKLFEDDLISIVDLKLSPWGNAKLRSNDTFSCQVLLFFPCFFSFKFCIWVLWKDAISWTGPLNDCP